MHLSRFQRRLTISRMMIFVILMGTAFAAIAEFGRVSRWASCMSGMRQARRMIAEVKGRRGTLQERPSDVALLEEIGRIETEKSKGADQSQPRFVGIVCIGIVLATLAALPPMLIRRMIRAFQDRPRRFPVKPESE